MDNRSCSSIAMFKLKKEQAAISIKKKKKKKFSRNRILLEERPFNLKSSLRLLEDASNTHVGLVCHAILSIYLME